MERLKRTVTRIASTPDSHLGYLPILHRSLIPLLSFASSLYRISLFLRRRLYLSGLLHQQRLPVPLISVGNLTWGGNGKTPMTEFIASFLDEAGIPPLILTRGYAGGDESKMLRRHLEHTSAKIGVGANRIGVARSIIERYGHMDPCDLMYFEKFARSHKFGPGSKNERIGAVILDDGMQHWGLLRDVEIVMLNGLMPCGNHHLLPRGSLREPFSALARADIVVIHHADLVSDAQLKVLEYAVLKVHSSINVYFTRLAPSYFFEVKNPLLKLPLSIVQSMVMLCVSAIGFPDAFVQSIKKIGPLHVDRLDFSDHHFVGADDVLLIRERLQELEDGLKVRAIIVVTEKDYDRDPAILKKLDDVMVLVLCCSIQIIPYENRRGENFKMNLKKLLTKEGVLTS